MICSGYNEPLKLNSSMYVHVFYALRPIINVLYLIQYDTEELKRSKLHRPV